MACYCLCCIFFFTFCCCCLYKNALKIIHAWACAIKEDALKEEKEKQLYVWFSIMPKGLPNTNFKISWNYMYTKATSLHAGKQACMHIWENKVYVWVIFGFKKNINLFYRKEEEEEQKKKDMMVFVIHRYMVCIHFPDVHFWLHLWHTKYCWKVFNNLKLTNFVSFWVM